MHPADEIRGSSSSKLAQKYIILGVTGSIAAVESIALARELIRHGAQVIPVMTPAATRIIHPDALEFATGVQPIIELSGKTEHVTFCGLTKNKVDLLLVSPCTSNTISKIVRGIDDTPVTTFATTAFGSKIPIILVPAMHLSMYDHQGIQENISQGKKRGIIFLEPIIKGNKAKMPGTDTIVANVIRTIGQQDLVGKKILIIGGGTSESIDDVRVITNKSSGKTAVALTRNAFERGADVKLWYGHASEPIPLFLEKESFQTVSDLQKLIKKTDLQQFDTIIVCAAIADYTPEKHKGKIPSGKKKLTLELTPTPKIIQLLQQKAPQSKLIGFKVEADKEKLQERAKQLLKTNHLYAVVANTTDTFGSTTTEIQILTKKGKTIKKKGNKEDLAQYILNTII
jgi:phosphopantothenoylcysteine decarboxylase / phosphopantothenate---cysteine ligase